MSDSKDNEICKSEFALPYQLTDRKLTFLPNPLPVQSGLGLPK